MAEYHRIGIWGASGSGKTTKAVKLTAGQDRRVIAFDPVLDKAIGRGAIRVKGLDRLWPVLDAHWYRSNLRIAYTPRSTEDCPGDLHKLCLYVIARQEADTKKESELTLLVDELNLSFPVERLPSGLYGFMDMCARGRHYRVNIIGISQRVAEVGTRFRGNTSSFYAFRVGDHTDAQTLSRMMGPEYRQQLIDLPNYDYFHVESGVVTKGRTDRM